MNQMTHVACNARIKKEGGKAKCCWCTVCPMKNCPFKKRPYIGRVRIALRKNKDVESFLIAKRKAEKRTEKRMKNVKFKGQKRRIKIQRGEI